MVLTLRPRALVAVVLVAAAWIALASSACVGTRAPERRAAPTAIAVWVELAGADGRAVELPASVRDRLVGELAARNLVASWPDPAGHAEVARQATTRARLDALGAASPATPYLMVVEARASFFSQLSGRYRWEVDVRTSVAARDALGDAQSDTSGVAAFLQYEHEREGDALAFARRQVLADLLRLVDRFFAGR